MPDAGLIYCGHMQQHSRFLGPALVAAAFMAPSSVFALQPVVNPNLDLGNLPPIQLADTVAPSVGQAGPLAADAGVATTFSAVVSDDVGVTACFLSFDKGLASAQNVSATIAAGVVSASVPASSMTAGTHTAEFNCTDAAGNAKVGASVSVSVAAPPSAPQPPVLQVPKAPIVLPSGVPSSGSLIKLVCPASAKSDHPCKAVYFFGADGKRHAFPNERAYFTWYADFDGVKEVSESVMNGIMLGKNVTYRPGVKMVKFVTVPKVYAVSKGGVLRGIASEAVASALYGSDWNKKIDDVSDAFFANYQFGADIGAAAEFDANAEKASASSIDAGF